MTEDTNSTACLDFQNQLQELLASGADLDNHSHLKDCAICRQLVDDLRQIAEHSRNL